MTIPATPSADAFRLEPREQQQFRDEGFLGPYPLFPRDEMPAVRSGIEALLQTPGPNAKNPVQSRHMDSALVYAIASHPAIVSRVADLYGPHLLLWATCFFVKAPGGKEIPWHQDLSYWPLEPLINLSAWIAIDEATVGNACVQVIPGSHKAVYPTVRSGPEMEFATMTDPAAVDETRKVDMELKPGEFFLFNEKLLHHSAANVSGKRRIGMTARYTLPIVKIDHDRPPLHPGHMALLVSGEDYMGLNHLGTPPWSA